jgi:hypothetical protein
MTSSGSKAISDLHNKNQKYESGLNSTGSESGQSLYEDEVIFN